MKRMLSVFLSAVMCFSLVACGSAPDSNVSSNAPDPTDSIVETKTLEYPFGVVNQPMDINGGYSYKTVCYSDNSLETNGYVYIRDYTVTPADEEGMTDRSVLAGFVYNDDNAYYYGTTSRVAYADMAGDGIIGGEDEWTVEVDGEEKTVTVLEDEFFGSEWLANNVFVTFYRLTVRMPENYDDIALFFYNTKNSLALSPDGQDMPEGTSVSDLVDSDTQWFILSEQAGVYYGGETELQQADADPAVIIYDRLFECEAPPPAPGSEIYDLLPPQPSEGGEEAADDIVEETVEGFPEENIPETDITEDFFDEENFDGIWVEIVDQTVYEIDGNAGYQPLNFFLDIHGWDESLQTRYQSFSDEDGIIQEFTFSAMESGSVSMDITGTEIKGDVVTFAFTVLDEEGFELSASYIDVPVIR